MNEFSSGEIQIFKSLFKGREDVFAVRWDKDNKGGYMPAYRYDPYLYRVHKMKGGTFQNYKDKTYLQLTDTEVKKHLIIHVFFINYVIYGRKKEINVNKTVTNCLFLLI